MKTRPISNALTLGALACVTVAAFGHLLDVEEFYRPVPGLAAMHEATALALALVGWALLRPATGICELREGGLLAVALAVSAMDLLNPTAFCQSGSAFDALTGQGDPGNRICFGRNSAVMVGALAVAVGLLRQVRPRAAQAATVVAMFPQLVAMTAMLFGIGKYAGDMSPLTMAAGLMVALAVLVRTGEHGVMALLLARSGAAASVRWPMLAVIAAVYAFGAVLRVTAREPMVVYWLALVTVMACYGLAGVMIWAQWRLRKLDRNRDDMARAMSDLAFADPLTGLKNRRAFDMAARAQLDPRPVPAAVMMLDIDHFKVVNDRYGHAAGDAVLIRVAKVLRSVLPAQAMSVRLGGEEFAAVLPEMTLAEASALAEDVRQAISDHPVTPESGQPVAVTVSIGCAARSAGEPIWVTLDRADAALYAAKAEGRNRVVRNGLKAVGDV
ncbi:GGDEF domain-containing protein [Marimonas lutisalis]|uniref:GGDEF domain-containing protein n=1 Tax=Marimonas lutisalis TaxID=2545756 RepID=UPI0010FA0CC0|nr:GGDEF domain-containing protein [Marimonas lutisalis]